MASQETLAARIGGNTRNPSLTPRMLNHVAWVTHDAAATADFYVRIMGMELCSTVFDSRIPSTGDDFPYLHLFFRLGDGSTIAFFESPGLPPRPAAAHPAYEIFDHLALQARDHAEVDRWYKWLQKNGIDLVGPNEHDGLAYSIYFHDPNGLRLEITSPTDPNWNNHVEQAYIDVETWIDVKGRAVREGRDLRESMLEVIRGRRQKAHALKKGS